ncbi:MAG TPA: hypothetical protein VHP58_06920 [Alphaproteobacteria bacterium]|nr:hypothetical protein [Alphaproteobacteria bacterium]
MSRFLSPAPQLPVTPTVNRAFFVPLAALACLVVSMAINAIDPPGPNLWLVSLLFFFTCAGFGMLLSVQRAVVMFMTSLIREKGNKSVPRVSQVFVRLLWSSLFTVVSLMLGLYTLYRYAN